MPVLATELCFLNLMSLTRLLEGSDMTNEIGLLLVILSRSPSCRHQCGNQCKLNQGSLGASLSPHPLSQDCCCFDNISQ